MYKCTIKGLPAALKNAWKNPEYEGQSFLQNSGLQDYIYESLNTFGTDGVIDWGDVVFSQSIGISNVTASVSDYKAPDVQGFTVQIGQIKDLPTQPVGFDINLKVASTDLVTENYCQDPDDPSISYGPFYETPQYQTDGVGFTLYPTKPTYESVYISNLNMGYIFPSIAKSINAASSEIQNDWQEFVCDPIKDVGLQCPKLNLPQGGATTEQISDGLESMLNGVLAEQDLSEYIDPIIQRTWNKKTYNNKVGGFSGEVPSCDDGELVYNQVTIDVDPEYPSHRTVEGSENFTVDYAPWFIPNTNESANLA